MLLVPGLLDERIVRMVISSSRSGTTDDDNDNDNDNDDNDNDNDNDDGPNETHEKTDEDLPS